MKVVKTALLVNTFRYTFFLISFFDRNCCYNLLKSAAFLIRTQLTLWSELCSHFDQNPAHIVNRKIEITVSFSVHILIRKYNDNPIIKNLSRLPTRILLFWQLISAIDLRYELHMRLSFVFSYSELTMKVTRRIVILILSVCLGFIVVNSVLRLNSKQTSTSSYDKEHSIKLPSITICLSDSHSWANKTIEDIHEDTKRMAKHFKADIWMSQDFRSGE